jgi:hypothetical protein
MFGAVQQMLPPSISLIAFLGTAWTEFPASENWVRMQIAQAW